MTEQIRNHNDYVDATMFGVNSSANTLGFFGSAALFGLPFPVNLLGGGVFLGPALVMKKRSIEAYSKTMVALLNGGDRGGEAAQRLVMKIAGICSYSGIRAAFQKHFKDSWKSEFLKLEFPRAIRVFAIEDLKFMAQELGMEIQQLENGNLKAVRRKEIYPERSQP